MNDNSYEYVVIDESYEYYDEGVMRIAIYKQCKDTGEYIEERMLDLDCLLQHYSSDLLFNIAEKLSNK